MDSFKNFKPHDHQLSFGVSIFILQDEKLGRFLPFPFCKRTFPLKIFMLQEELSPHLFFLHPATLKHSQNSVPHISQRLRPTTCCFQIFAELFLIHNLNFLTPGDTSSRGGYVLPLICCCKHLSPLNRDFFFPLKMKGCFQKHCNDLRGFFSTSIQFMTHTTNVGCKTFSCYNVQKVSGKVIICFIKVKFAVDR